jgi:PAS domain S-box-containing protein
VVAAVAIQGRLGDLSKRRSVGIRRGTVLTFVVVVAAYVAAARLGLELSVAHGVITPVWPPTGIALAALLLCGPRFWPAIATGAFLANATSGHASIPVAASISVGNTLEALVAVYLLRKVDFRSTFERASDVLWFTAIAAFLCTAISATHGVTTLAIAGAPAASSYGSAWVLWWLGDAMGALLVAPAILLTAARVPRIERRRRWEALGLLALVAGTSAIVFLQGHWRYPYAVFGALVWATLRFRQLGAAVGSLVVAAIAVAGTLGSATPLGSDATTTVQVLQALLAFVAVSLLVLGAALEEREKANAGLAEAQALAHLGAWEWDLEADRISWSHELCRMFGVDSGTRSLTFDGFLARVHPHDRDAMRRAVQRSLETHEPFEVVHRIVLADGSERYVHGRGRVVVGSTGAPSRMVGTAQDVTERHRAETVRDNILSAVSHELRTPLTAILGFALTLDARSDAVDDELRRRMTTELKNQALKLDRLLANLLDVDRLRHGSLELAVEPTDVAALVERTVSALEWDGRRIELRTSEAVADVDPAKLERMVENLVTNALKHTPPGTSVNVCVTHDDRSVLVRVDDAGPGIADAHKLDIFEPFARANGASEAPGTGIGLALVAQFAALQGGRAWVEDNAGGGASFRVSLPLHSR